MNYAVAFIVLVFAVYRLAVLVAEDAITSPARQFLAARGLISLNEHGDWCVSCASVWAAGAVLPLALYVPLAVIVLALSGAARWLWMKE